MNQLAKYLPILQWLPHYNKQYLRGDLSAGLTVGVMLIPQGLAYAMVAGVPPIYGLYAATVPLVIYALLGTSRQLAIGPVAMDSLLVGASVGLIATSGTAEYISFVIMLGLMVGLIELLMGIFKLGFLVNFLSRPVISGFTSAAALIISISQLKHLIGIEIPRSDYIHQTLGYALTHFADWSLPTLLIGVIGMAIIVGLKKVSPLIPAPLVVVALGIVAVWLLGWGEMVKIIGTIPSGLPSFTFNLPDKSQALTLLPVAGYLAVVGVMEAISIAKTLEIRGRDHKIDNNQELIALGFSNIMGSMFQAFPVTGSFSRSAVSAQAGAKTQLVSLLAAGLMVLTLLFLTPLFYFLPKAILASIIMVAVIKLVKVKEAKRLWREDRHDFFMLLVTFAGTLSLGIIEGMILGAVLSLAVMIYKSVYPHVAVLGQLPGTYHYRNIKRFPECIHRKDILIVRFDARLYFANAAYLKDQLVALEEKQSEAIRLMIFSMDSIPSVDSTAIQVLEEIAQDYKSRDIAFYLTDVMGPVRDKFHRTGLVDVIGRDNFFLDVHEGVSHFAGHDRASYHVAKALQTNWGKEESE